VAVSTNTILWVVLILCITYSSARVSKLQQAPTSSSCSFVYGNWGACTSENIQNRTIACVCGTLVDTNLIKCLSQEVAMQSITRNCPSITDVDGDDDDDDDSDDDDDGDDEETVCKWKWTKWTQCSADCGGGNTTRYQVCVCEGANVAVPSTWCDDETLYGVEKTVCNDFKCGGTPAFNKIYWTYKEEQGTWPIKDGVFNCSMGVDPTDTDSPKGKSYSSVLLDPTPEDHTHSEWYLIAKEWIAAELNIANGVTFTPDALEIISQMGNLLDYCNGWPTQDVYEVYAGKEKLGRLNNNIGGLSNVDAELALLQGHSYSDQSNSPEESAGNLALLITIPLVAVLIIGVAIGLTVYYVREKRNAVVEQVAFESEDDASEGEPLQATAPQGVPLETDKTAQQ